MELGSVNFRESRSGAEGYDPDEVDAFVLEVVQALRQDPPTMAPWEVRDKVFTISRRHRRYDEHDVDDFLDLAERRLREAHGQELDVPGPAVPAQPGRRWWWPWG
ncbi:MAG: DivIVA domain-containing protein [Nocardioidaceae bacterium]|nr:MAG: DivIVA domain-containing protein [Nocardioidaceae bacterium]